MLINYTFSNCYSFKHETTLSLEKGERLRKFPNNKMSISTKKSGNKIDLLKNIVIFGSNGSGKSNLLKSLDLMKHIILNIPSKVTSKIPERKFLMDDKSVSKPTSFEVEFIQNDTQYKYSFSYMKSKILNEKLEVFNKNQYNIYFERTENNTFIITPNSLNEVVKETRENVLFLQKGQDKNDYACKDVITWFEETLVFFSEVSSRELFYLLEDDENKKRFLKFLSFADMNIIDVEIEESSHEMPEKVQDALKNLLAELTDDPTDTFEPGKLKRLFTIYKKYDSEGNVIKNQKIHLDQESSGTQKIIFIALNILFCKDNNKVLILDEFDDSFHQELAEALIKVFNSKGNENQFIVTSHELNLMDANLRKDQIYFTEKRFNGESELFSLFDFDDFKITRGDTQYYKRYIKGLFGAMPNIEADEMLNMFS